MLIASQNDDQVEFGILQQVVVLGRTIRRAKPSSITLPARTIGRTDCTQRNAIETLQIRQVRPACESSGPDQPNSQIAVMCLSGSNRDFSARLKFALFISRWIT